LSGERDSYRAIVYYHSSALEDGPCCLISNGDEMEGNEFESESKVRSEVPDSSSEGDGCRATAWARIVILVSTPSSVLDLSMEVLCCDLVD
jgi:hypothetical protein